MCHGHHWLGSRWSTRAQEETIEIYRDTESSPAWDDTRPKWLGGYVKDTWATSQNQLSDFEKLGTPMGNSTVCSC